MFHNLHPSIPKYISEADSSYYWQPSINIKGVVQADREIFSFYTHPGAMILNVEEKGVPSTYGSYQGNSILFEI